MSNIDKRALREAAEKALSAGDGNWQTWREAGMNYPEIFTSSGHIVATVNGSFAVVRSDFIAAANPATVLALLDELEAAEKRIAELEAREVNGRFPLPKDSSQGWKIDPEFIGKIQDAIGYDEECQCWEGSPSMEMVEAVLIAAAAIKMDERG
ncbi:ead/Ea22-like family protein [Enterobacter hormaechei]|uniref:ead/Ea22-like family protein n=1 Tax=Enterobacter hormaechei TaxID=158836 RepID=UPI0028E52769|nr:ead/Ea22-like family protein [Enterobacter hormaechei]MCW3144569.1 ead/Ea22-like family protein [Enterobacter hormaechei]